jgi:hypothetical protein
MWSPETDAALAAEKTLLSCLPSTSHSRILFLDPRRPAKPRLQNHHEPLQSATGTQVTHRKIGSICRRMQRILSGLAKYLLQRAPALPHLFQ